MSYLKHYSLSEPHYSKRNVQNILELKHRRRNLEDINTFTYTGIDHQCISDFSIGDHWKNGTATAKLERNVTDYHF